MSETLSTALRLHQSGQLDQAELIYRQILDDDPYEADALHLLGVIAFQRGRTNHAVEMIKKAINLRPDVATFHSNLAEAYRQGGNFAKALEHGKTSLELQPDSAEIHNNIGLALQGSGKKDEAVTHFRKAIELKPDFAMAYNNLGNTLREVNKPDDAIAALREAVRLDPALPQARCNLGQMLLEHNQSAEALLHCQEAVRLKPDFPEGLSNLGNVLRELDRLEEAKDCYARAIHLQPRLAMAFNNMGQALQQEDKFDEAFGWYHKALEIDPRSARIHCNLASLLAAKEREEEAIDRYNLALQLQPDYAEAHNGLAYVYQERGEPQKALACYREALRLKPDFIAAKVNLGQILEEMGDIDQAMNCFREALEIDSNHVGALASLATVLKDKLPTEEERRLEEQLAKEDSNDSKRSVLHYGLAHVLDARKEYAEAAEHMRKANALRLQGWIKQGQSYSPLEHSRFVDSLIENFTPTFFERVRGWGLDTDLPVFIIGLPRSSTTLTEQILASHPKIFGAGELRFAKDDFDSMPKTLGISAPAAACAAFLDQNGIKNVATSHLEKLRALDSKAERIVDKMPDNYLYVGLLAALFPKAKYIHCRRDVRDVALSCWITNFKSIRWACDLEHIAARVRDYQRLMEHWKKVLPVPMLEIHYEDTVADLEGVARKLVDWCGMEWDPACLAFHETKRPVRTASVTQVRQPIYKKSVKRWKNYEGALSPLLQMLGPLPEREDATVGSVS